MPRLDLVGKRFGRLLVTDRTAADDYKKRSWLCACDCGNEKVIAGSSLRSGASKSCGCARPGIFCETLRSRLERQITVTPGCWIWTGFTHPNGYGHMQVNGRPRRAHRVSYEIYCGPIPPGLFVLHSCDNRACVNPDHLRVGTHQDNMRDMVERERYSCLPGESAPNAVLSNAQVRSIYADPRLQKVIATDYGITRGTVSQIKTRRSWAHLDMSASV